jgi:hypothetical protein
MMIPPKKYVREDPDRTWRVGDKDISLDSVGYVFLQGHSVETIADGVTIPNHSHDKHGWVMIGRQA